MKRSTLCLLKVLPYENTYGTVSSTKTEFIITHLFVNRITVHNFIHEFVASKHYHFIRNNING